MNLLKHSGAVLAALFSCFISQASAQSEAELIEAFSGEWFIFEPRFSVNDFPCRIVLDTGRLVNRDVRLRRAEADSNCSAPLTGSNLRWLVEDGKIVIRDAASSNLAVLGGNPERLTGDLNGPVSMVILERKQGVPFKRQLVAALDRHKCYFVGYSSECAGADKTRAVSFSAGPATIDVLVDLNVRNQPRRNAPIVGTVPRDSQITVNLCLTASDGVWCRAGFGEISGWMAKSAIRSGEWPVVTFVQAPG